MTDDDLGDFFYNHLSNPDYLRLTTRRERFTSRAMAAWTFRDYLSGDRLLDADHETYLPVL